MFHRQVLLDEVAEFSSVRGILLPSISLGKLLAKRTSPIAA